MGSHNAFPDARQSPLKRTLHSLFATLCAHGSLPTVELDVDLCRIADAYCEEMVSNGYTGHFSLDGRTPYQRFVHVHVLCMHLCRCYLHTG